MRERKHIDKDILEKEYSQDRLLLEDIAKRHNVSLSFIYTCLEQYQIPKRPRTVSIKRCLECGEIIASNGYHYNRKFCSTKCSANYRHKHTWKIDEETLRKEYVEDKLELTEIGQQHGMSVVSVCNYLKRYNIAKRINYIDFTGKRVGKLVVIEPISKNHKGGGRHVIWRCRCDCGREYNTYSHHLSRCITIQCDKCRHEQQRSKLELTEYIWSIIKRSAVNRRIEFKITREFAYDLFLKQDRKCALSGVEIKFAETARAHSRNKGTTASLDRKDSAKDYTEDNVQWIHKNVNLMKGQMTDQGFIEWCEKIVEHNLF